MNFFIIVIGVYWLISYTLISLMGAISPIYKKARVKIAYWCMNILVISALGLLRVIEANNFTFIEGKILFSYIAMQLMALLLSPIFLTAKKIINIKDKNVDESKRKMLKGFAYGVPTLSLGLSLYGTFNESENIKRNEYDIPITDLPGSLSGFRIVQISDIHLGLFFSLEKLERVLDSFKKEKADVLFITGDLIDDISMLKKCIKLIEKYQVYFPKGIFISWGNHEHMRNFNVIDQSVRSSDIKILCNSSYKVSEDLFLLGVDYPFDNTESKRQTMLETALQNVPDKVTKILLSHHPDFIEEAYSNKINLTLTGHTHGGQFPGYAQIMSMHYKFYKGLYVRGNFYGYVNVGLGHWMPFRLGCRPEVTIFTLKLNEV